MKARIPKLDGNNKDPKKKSDVKLHAKSSDFEVKLGQPISELDKKIRDIYEATLKKVGEHRKIDVVESMAKMSFIKLFNPGTPYVRKRVTESIGRLGESVINEELGTMVEDIISKSKGKISIEMIIEKMQTKNFSEKLKSLFPSNMSDKTDRAVSRYIEEKTKEIEEKQASKRAEEVEVSKRKEQERAFFEKASDYTKGFRFLAMDKVMYTSENGHFDSEGKSKKFSSLEEYERFRKIQSAVRNQMAILRVDELTAINSILENRDANKDAELADTAILRARYDLLNKKKPISPNEQEM